MLDQVRCLWCSANAAPNLNHIRLKGLAIDLLPYCASLGQRNGDQTAILSLDYHPTATDRIDHADHILSAPCWGAILPTCSASLPIGRLATTLGKEALGGLCSALLAFVYPELLAAKKGRCTNNQNRDDPGNSFTWLH
jgi:hypothetical protein